VCVNVHTFSLSRTEQRGLMVLGNRGPARISGRTKRDETGGYRERERERGKVHDEELHNPCHYLSGVGRIKPTT
jgi:hypothetical protein